MSIKKSKNSVAKILSKKGNIVGYLSSRDEENGLDIRLDSQGYKIVALWQQKRKRTKMDKKELYEIVANMTEQLGTDVLLENLAMAMSYDDLKENLEYIDRMYDLENFWISTIAVNGWAVRFRHTALKH